MNPLSEREIRDLLTPRGTPAPPAGLAARLKSEIPEHVEVAPSGAARFGRRSPLRTYLLAAGVLMAFGGAFLVYRVRQEMAPPHLESIRKDDGAAAARTAADRSVPAIADADEIAVPASEAAPATSKLAIEEAEEAAPPVRTAEPRRQEKQEKKEGAEPAARRKAREQVAAAPGEQTEAEPEARAAGEELPEGRVVREELRSLGFVDSAHPAAARAELAPSSDSVYVVDRGAGLFVDSADAALSTFAPDAGTASYAAVRHFLRDGRLPPPAAVRVEELLNHFDYGEPSPRGDAAIHAEGAPSPFAEGVQLLRFHLGTTAAARVQVELNPEVVARYRLVGYENRGWDADRLRRGTLAAGDVPAAGETRGGNESLAAGETPAPAAGGAVTVLYELQLRRPLRRGDAVATLHLRYGSAVGCEAMETERRVTGQDFAGTWADASAALRLTGLAAEFGEILAGGYRARPGDLGEVLRRARELAAERPGDAAAAELASLVGRAAEHRR